MTVRLGLVGLGNWGGKLARTVADIDGAALASCFARTEATRRAFAEEHSCLAAPSLEAMLDDVDGVLIATPHTTHEPLVVAAAASGTHIMVEKPMTLTADAAQRCVDAAHNAGVLLQVAHYRRRLGATRVIKQLIDEGTIGRIHQIEGRFHRSWGPDLGRPWRDTSEEAPGGAMTALGIHVIDNFLYLGGPIVRLTARSEQLGAVTPIDDITTVMVEFASGAFGTMATSARLPFESTTAVYGDGATAWAESDAAELFIQMADEMTRTQHQVETVDGVEANLAAFANSIRTGEAPETDGMAGLAVVKVFEGLVQSAADHGRWVEIAPDATD